MFEFINLLIFLFNICTFSWVYGPKILSFSLGTNTTARLIGGWKILILFYAMMFKIALKQWWDHTITEEDEGMYCATHILHRKEIKIMFKKSPLFNSLKTVKANDGLDISAEAVPYLRVVPVTFTPDVMGEDSFVLTQSTQEEAT